MRHSKSILFLGSLLLTSSSSFGMDHVDLSIVPHEKEIIGLNRTIPVAEVIDDTSLQILGKNFACGFIENTVIHSCDMFENALHNTMVTHGSAASAKFFELIGGKTGDLLTKKAIDMSVSLLVEAADLPNMAPNALLKVSNAMTILNGALSHFVMKRLNDELQTLENKVKGTLRKEIQKRVSPMLATMKDSASKAVLELGTDALVEYSLEQMSKPIHKAVEDHINNFIKSNEILDNYNTNVVPFLKSLESGTAVISESMASAILTLYPMNEAKNKLTKHLQEKAQDTFSWMRTCGEFIGANTGYVFGKVAGTYLAHECSDRYLTGIGAKLSDAILDTPYLMTLRQAQLETDVYDALVLGEIRIEEMLEQEIRERELTEKLAAEKEAARLKDIEDYAKAHAEEINEVVEMEKDYENAYVLAYQNKTNSQTFMRYLTTPVTTVASWTVDTLKAGANMGYNAATVIYSTGVSIKNLATNSLIAAKKLSHNAVRKTMSPKIAYKLGSLSSEKMFVSLEKAIVNHGAWTKAEVYNFLHHKVEKDLSYKMSKFGFSTLMAASQVSTVIYNLPAMIEQDIQLAVENEWLSPFMPDEI